MLQPRILPDQESHSKVLVWIVDPSDARVKRNRDEYFHLLDADERAACDRLRLDRDRHLYLIAHALLRTTLSRFAEVAPDEWRFSRTAHGKPELLRNAGLPEDLRFNLSHTQGLAACVVVRGADVGIDAEAIDRVTEPEHLGRTVLSGSELVQLQSLPSQREQQEFFTECWCLKEAFTKALGIGLTTPFDHLNVLRDRQGSIRVDGHERSGEAWRFFCMRPTDGHCLAVAVSRTEAAELEIRRVIPGHG